MTGVNEPPRSKLASACVAAAVSCWLLLGSSPAMADATAHPRARLFATAREDPATSLLTRARWSALFFLRPWDCTPEVRWATRALRRAAAEFPDLQVLTVVPRSSLLRLETYGEPLPGEVVGVDDSLYRLQAEIAPVPRIEVWDFEGHLLLMRSLPRVISEEGLYEEIIWSRSFTRPVPPEAP